MKISGQQKVIDVLKEDLKQYELNVQFTKDIIKKLEQDEAKRKEERRVKT